MAEFNTRQLAASIEHRKKPLPFFLSRYFPTIFEFETEQIVFDYLFQNRKLAPFVAPVVEGRVISSDGRTSKNFKPAYVKPKHFLNPGQSMKRRVGEALNGNMSPAQRRELQIAENFMIEDEMIDNRLEWMAAQAMRTGAVVVEGEDYPTQTVDFGRDADLDETLLTTARWDDSAPDPLNDLQVMSQTMSTKPYGAPARDIIFSATPWSLFSARDDAQKLINTDYRGNESSSFMRGPIADGDTVEWVGRINNFDLWLDTREYEDESGSMVKYLPDGEVLLATQAIEGVQTFGAILDDDAMHPMRAFPKSWKEKDPSRTVTMTQSAPLPVPQRHNACARLIVIS